MASSLVNERSLRKIARLDEESDVSSDMEIEVKIYKICVDSHDVYLQFFARASS